MIVERACRFLSPSLRESDADLRHGSARLLGRPRGPVLPGTGLTEHYSSIHPTEDARPSRQRPHGSRLLSSVIVSVDSFHEYARVTEPYETGALLPMQQIHPLLGFVMT
jgi:hypothetical protein